VRFVAILYEGATVLLGISSDYGSEGLRFESRRARSSSRSGAWEHRNSRNDRFPNRRFRSYDEGRALWSRRRWRRRLWRRVRGCAIHKPPRRERSAAINKSWRKTNPPAGMSQRADRETCVALSRRQRLHAYIAMCELGSLQSL